MPNVKTKQRVQLLVSGILIGKRKVEFRISVPAAMIAIQKPGENPLHRFKAVAREYLMHQHPDFFSELVDIQGRILEEREDQENPKQEEKK